MFDNKKLFMILIYFLGVITPFVFLVFLAIIGIKTDKSEKESSFSKWNITECNDVLLLANVLEEPNYWCAIGIERDPNTQLLQRVGVVKGQNKQGESNELLFVYELKGYYDMPSARYSSSGLVWYDFNLDGRFDQLHDYNNEKKEINVDGRWVQGFGKKDIKTETGIFRFDPNTGKWNLIMAMPKSGN